MTLVVDASVLAEFVLGTSKGRQAAAVFDQHGAVLHAPALIIAETLSALRSLERRAQISRTRADEAVADLLAVPLRGYPSETVARRVWSLGGRITVYDAHYVALAEALGAPLITGDRRLAAATDGLIELITL